MELNEIQQLIACFEASGMHSLELSRAGTRLRLKRADSAAPRVAKGNDAADSSPDRSLSAAASAAPVVRAQSAGIFLATHPMRKAPFVKTGDTVRQDDVVGLLKVGLICAPVTAPCAGVVAKIVAADGQMLGFGSPVLELLPTLAGPL